MQIIFQILLILGLVCCKVAQRSETINVLSGESVVLRCSWDYKGSLFWIRLIPGKLPEVLGKAFGPKPTDQRIKITEESQAAFLRIARTTTSDTGYYYCMKYTHVVFFSKEIHLSVNGLESSTVTNISPHELHPGATANSQCLHDSDFSDDIFLSQCCRRSNSISPALTRGNDVGTSADKKAGFLIKKLLCCLLKNGNHSEFSCAVALCEDGVVSEQDIDGSARKWHWGDEGPLFLSLAAALALSLIVNALCCNYIRKQNKTKKEAFITLQQMASAAKDDQCAEESVLYSAPDFTRRKSRGRPEEYEECCYTEVRKLGLN